MERIKQKTENIYNADVTKRYYETVGEDAESGKYKTEIDKYFNSLIPQNFSNKAILDHGCGNGRYSELFCQRGAKKVLGVDISSAMIQEATKRKREQQINQLDFVRGSIDNLPVGKEKFDLIFSRFSLVYSPNIKKVMRQISVALKENGEVLIETNAATIKGNKDEIQKSAIPLILRLGESEVPIKNFAITVDEYLDAFREAGLKVIIKKNCPASEITIEDDYKNKHLIDFEVFVFVLKKEKENE